MKLTKKQKIFFSICAVAVACLVIGFISILALVKSNYLFKMDGDFISFSLNMRNNFWNGFFKTITHLGSVYLLMIVAIITAIFIKPIMAKLLALANFGGAAILNIIVKYAVQRTRPIGLGLIEETGYSFPSAHAMLSLVALGFVAYWLWKILDKRWLKITISVLVGFIVLIVGFSRVYLGVHFITDVLAGWLLGGAVLICSICAYELIVYLKKVKDAEKPKDF